MLSIAIGGFMGVGKSTAARMLAERMGFHFVDLDTQIERNEGRSVAAIFVEDGEERFRGLETSALSAALEQSPVVVALGGGALHRAENIKALEGRAHVLVLWMPLEAIKARLGPSSASRPLWREADQLFLSRSKGYRSVGTLVDVEGLSRTDVVGALQEAISCD